MQLNTAMTTTAVGFVGTIVVVYHLPRSRADRLELASTQQPATKVIDISSLVRRLLVGLGLGAHRAAPVHPGTVPSNHGEHPSPGQAASPEATINAHQVRVASTFYGGQKKTLLASDPKKSFNESDTFQL